ncbi:transmembrane protein 44 [Rhinophrynus dorsalis]
MDGPWNVTLEDTKNSGLWSWDYLIGCFAQEKICVSFGLWILSCLFWLTSCSIQMYLRCKRKSSREESVFWDIYSFFGSMCNTVGALLSKQLTIQVITGCYMALADIINFIFTLFPVCSSRYRRRSGQKNSRRRMKHRDILSALSISLFVGFGYSLNTHGYLSTEVPHTPQRRLLGTALQERTDVVGFTLGIIAVIVSWTARVPAITKVCRGTVFPVLQIWAVLFSALASLLYAAAIMSHDRHPEYFFRAIPWFLISMGAAALDVALMFLSCIMKHRLLLPMGFVAEAMEDTESRELLPRDDEEDIDGIQQYADEEEKSWTPLNMVPNRGLPTKPSLGRYVRLSIEQVQEEGITAVRLPGDGQTNAGTNSDKEPLYYLDLPMYPPAHVTLTKLSSPSSSEVSSGNTELEWDFEDLNPNWDNDADIPSIQPKDSSVLNSGIRPQLCTTKSAVSNLRYMTSSLYDQINCLRPWLCMTKSAVFGFWYTTLALNDQVCCLGPPIYNLGFIAGVVGIIVLLHDPVLAKF